jgi:site-specific recombinase XerD
MIPHAQRRRHKTRNQEPLSPEDLAKVLNAPVEVITDVRDQLIAEIVYCLGPSLEELRATRVADVDLDRDVLSIPGDKARNVPIPSRTRDLLVKYLTTIRPFLGAKGPKDDALFVSQWGTPLNIKGLELRITALGVAGGVATRVNSSVLRATGVRDMLARGVSQAAIYTLYGIKAPETTRGPAPRPRPPKV